MTTMTPARMPHIPIEMSRFSLSASAAAASSKGSSPGWLEKVSSARLQAGDAGPLSAVLTYVTRRDYFPSRDSIAQFLHNVLIKREVAMGGGGDEPQAGGPGGHGGRADRLGEDALLERAR